MIFIILNHYLPYPCSFSHMETVEFSRGHMICDDIISLMANHCVFWCFKNLSPVIPNTPINISIYNIHKTRAPWEAQ